MPLRRTASSQLTFDAPATLRAQPHSAIADAVGADAERLLHRVEVDVEPAVI